MNLIKNDPFKPAIARGFFDDFFNGTVSDFMGSDYGMTIPAVNVRETEEGYFLELAVPGLTKEDFNISVEKNLLLVSSEKETSSESEEGKIRRKEFNYSSFRRSFHLPKSVDKDKIEAKYDNGVLNLTLPKKEEVLLEEKGRMIEIG